MLLTQLSTSLLPGNGYLYIDIYITYYNLANAWLYMNVYETITKDLFYFLASFCTCAYTCSDVRT